MNSCIEADEMKRKIIVDMALGFTATIRVFEKKSKRNISILVLRYLSEIEKVKTKAQFERLHRDFCLAFVTQIRTASKVLKNRERQLSVAASYGHAAKLLDICAKVWFYYCDLPSAKVAARIQPWLHIAIDTPILNYLRRNYKSSNISARHIGDIDEADYVKLQTLANDDRLKNCEAALLAVQYDDILWYALNKPAPEV